MAKSFPSTVAEKEAELTPRERKGARQAQAALPRLGYPSREETKNIMRRQSVSDIPFHTRDVENALNTWGERADLLKGKSTGGKSAPIPPRPVKFALRVQTMMVDICFVAGMAFQVALLQPMQFAFVQFLPQGRSEDSVRNAFRSIFQLCNAHSVVVDKVRSDNEGAFKANASFMNEHGAAHEPCGPGRHVAPIERFLRVLKERVRCYVHKSPYNLPAMWLPMLMMCSIILLNATGNSHRGDHLSPMEAFTGRKVSFTKDLPCAFGDYVQATVPETSNDMSARTEEMIAMYPILNNGDGTWAFYNLSTNKLCARNKFTVMPSIPDSVIAHINKLASYGPSVTKDKVVSQLTHGLDNTPVGTYDAADEAMAEPSDMRVVDHRQPIPEATFRPSDSPGVSLGATAPPSRHIRIK